MNPELKAVIENYIDTSRKLFTLLAIELDIQLPISGQDWSRLEIEWTGTTRNGLKYRKHGYGVEIWFRGETVDFDIGSEGELDGVDPWRLYYYAEDNGISLPYSSVSEVQQEFKRLSAKRELIYSGYINYYFPSST